MKFRSFFTILMVGVLVLLLVGAGGFLGLRSKSSLSLAQAATQLQPEAAIFVPKQAPIMASLLVSAESLETFRVAAAPAGQRRRARAELAQLEKSILAPTGLTYADDIQPWLGDEVTFAVTASDLDRNRDNGLQPGYLLAVATQDPNRSREFLQLFWQKRAVSGKNLVFEQYSGVKLIYAESPQLSSVDSQSPPPSTLTPIPTLSSAVVGDRFILFANHPKVLRDAITNVQAPGLNLTSSSRYQNSLQNLPSSGIGLTVINLPELATWLGTSTDTPLPDGAAAGTYDSLVVALQLDRRGIVGETALLTAPDETLTASRPVLSRPAGALQFIPSISPVVASSVDLQSFWTQLSDELSDGNRVSGFVNQVLNGLQDRWNLNVSKDVFRWVTREYAIALMPRPDQAEPDWIFVAEKSADATKGIDQLDAIAKRQGLSVGPIMLDEQEVVAWTQLSAAMPASSRRSKAQGTVALSADVQGVHTSVGRYEIFATSVDAMNQALGASDDSILSSDEFQQAIAPIANSNDGYLYVDWTSIRDAVKQRLPLTGIVEAVGKPFFDHWRSITVSGYGSKANMRRGVVFIRLQD
ncbi:MAG: DUF3352 domain-containing protein [Elainellaceae cyanobacterium]